MTTNIYIIYSFKISWKKPEITKSLGTTSCRYECNIKTYMKEAGCEDGDCIISAEDEINWLLRIGIHVSVKGKVKQRLSST
jgi:hypothetical protein